MNHKYQGNNIQGWMDEAELQWLYKTAKTMKSIVEIGCWKGRSTHALLSGCPGKVFAIDTFAGNPEQLDYEHKEALAGNIYSEFINNTKQFDNLIVMRDSSVNMSKFFRNKSIDMVFIDGSHYIDNVVADILNWLPICNTLLCGHDLNMSDVNFAIQGLNLEVELVEHTVIWVYQIKN
jgi:predicted O-methyltransferase YrrM